MSPYSPHILFTQQIWETHIQQGDLVIDATCGNGHDTLVLAQLALSSSKGTLFSFDIQKEALDTAQKRIASHCPDLFDRIQWIQDSHVHFPQNLKENSVSLIVYNLGYLPGGNKQVTTTTASTLESIQKAQSLIKEEGLICITCYPRHEEEGKEEKALIEWIKTLPKACWECQFIQWMNRPLSPSVILLRKIPSL